MPPDLNSLPTSRPTSISVSPLSQRPRRISTSNAADARPSLPSPRSPSLSSFQPAAAIHAGLGRSPSRGLERRRSSLMNNLTNINDPAMPAPRELQSLSERDSASPRLGRRSFILPTADPHHQRQPSLGELHQELENEQEAQVNRLLHMIRLQQDQLASLQRQSHGEPSSPNTDYTGLPTPPSALSTPTGTTIAEQSSPRSSSVSHSYLNRPHSLSRQSPSRLSNPGTNSRGNSPALRPQSRSLGSLTEDFRLGQARDDGAFYEELMRENQVLKERVLELGAFWIV